MPAIRLPLAAALCLAGALVGAAADAGVRGTARSGGRPEANAVVWLEAPIASKTPQTGRVVLDQKNLMFSPHVLAVRVGTVVDFPNDDRVFHNVFSFRDGKRFDLGMYPVGAVRQVTFDRPGLSRIFCNIHPQMAAYVMAVDSPYFGAADRTGAFTLGDVPPGTYTYQAWRPGGPTLSGSFSAGAGSRLDVQWP
jgi:plastocyanin